MTITVGNIGLISTIIFLICFKFISNNKPEDTPELVKIVVTTIFIFSFISQIASALIVMFS